MIYEESGAIFSDCRIYRFLLWRVWDTSKDNLLFVCLNPSAAGAYSDDNTSRRCAGFALCAGFGGFYLCNLFGFISTRVSGLHTAPNPVGNPDNDSHLSRACSRCSAVVVAWGNDRMCPPRDHTVLQLLKSHFRVVYCLSKTGGYPRHPLLLPNACKLTPFT